MMWSAYVQNVVNWMIDSIVWLTDTFLGNVLIILLHYIGKVLLGISPGRAGKLCFFLIICLVIIIGLISCGIAFSNKTI